MTVLRVDSTVFVVIRKDGHGERVWRGTFFLTMEEAKIGMQKAIEDQETMVMNGWMDNNAAGVTFRVQPLSLQFVDIAVDNHPNCHLFTTDKGPTTFRDCMSDGHYLCRRCTRRVDDN